MVLPHVVFGGPVLTHVVFGGSQGSPKATQRPATPRTNLQLARESVSLGTHIDELVGRLATNVGELLMELGDLRRESAYTRRQA